MRRLRVIKKGIKFLLLKPFCIKITLRIEIVQCKEEINIVVKMIKCKNTYKTCWTVLVYLQVWDQLLKSVFFNEIHSQDIRILTSISIRTMVYSKPGMPYIRILIRRVYCSRSSSWQLKGLRSSFSAKLALSLYSCIALYQISGFLSEPQTNPFECTDSDDEEACSTQQLLDSDHEEDSDVDIE